MYEAQSIVQIHKNVFHLQFTALWNLPGWFWQVSSMWHIHLPCSREILCLPEMQRCCLLLEVQRFIQLWARWFVLRTSLLYQVIQVQCVSIWAMWHLRCYWQLVFVFVQAEFFHTSNLKDAPLFYDCNHEQHTHNNATGWIWII